MTNVYDQLVDISAPYLTKPLSAAEATRTGKAKRTKRLGQSFTPGEVAIICSVFACIERGADPRTLMRSEDFRCVRAKFQRMASRPAPEKAAAE